MPMYPSAPAAAIGVRRYGPVAAFPLSLVIGLIAGFLGAIPPGPLGVTCLRKALQGHRRDAYRVAVGGSITDTLVCGLIAFGLGWILEKVVTNVVVRTVLAVFLLGYGLKLLVIDAKKDAARSAALRRLPDFRLTPAARREDEQEDESGQPERGGIRPVVTGLLQGLANPALFVNWTILVGFLVGHRLLVLSAGTAAGFALGVGLGVFLWFVLLIELGTRWRDRGGAWLGHATLVAGVLLVGFGAFFTWRSFAVK